MWDKFYEICSHFKPGAKLLIKSANGVGKTELMAALANYCLECFDKSRVLCTGSSWTSLKDILFPRIHKFISEHDLHPTARRNEMDITYREEHDIVAKSPRDPEGIAGFHADMLVQLVEEASGISERIATAIDGNNVGGRGIEVWQGNPLVAAGPFFERAGSGEYIVITISAFDHPNVKQGTEIIAGAVTREKVEERAKRWCKPCAPGVEGAVHLWWLGDKGWFIPDFRFRARVMGEFPEEVEGALFNRTALKAASRREPTGGPPTALGCDVARSPVGDETVIALANTHGILALFAKQGNDVMETGKWIMDMIEAYPTINRIAVDDSGVGGGVTDFLRHQELGEAEVMPINFAGEPIVKDENFLNIKAEIHWRFKDRLDTDKAMFLPNDAELLAQASQIKPDFSLQGHNVKIKIEDKKEYKKRVGRSPDRIEACIIALHAAEFAESAAVPEVYLPNGNASMPTDDDLYGRGRVWDNDRNDPFESDRRSLYDNY